MVFSIEPSEGFDIVGGVTASSVPLTGVPLGTLLGDDLTPPPPEDFR